MTLIDKIRDDLNQALKNKDQNVVSILRYLLSEINNFSIAKYPPVRGGLPKNGLPDEDVISVISKLVKTHQESIAQFKAGNRQDLVEKEEQELLILKNYLPAQASEEEIRKMAFELKTQGITDFGQMMKNLMAKLKGKAQGELVAKIVKEILQEKK